MWTQSTRLASLNGARWTCEGESNIRKKSTLIYVDINESKQIKSVSKTEKSNSRIRVYKNRFLFWSHVEANFLSVVAADLRT